MTDLGLSRLDFLLSHGIIHYIPSCNQPTFCEFEFLRLSQSKFIYRTKNLVFRTSILLLYFILSWTCFINRIHWNLSNTSMLLFHMLFWPFSFPNSLRLTRSRFFFLILIKTNQQFLYRICFVSCTYINSSIRICSVFLRLIWRLSFLFLYCIWFTLLILLLNLSV